ncbi:hypothetical protein LTR15_000035 [Elasticomyces elasticus]|nr:hypothetical protein LTR15_000035 [Elasticomyces elasticus]
MDVTKTLSHAPNFAILATNHLIRHEALEMGKAAVEKFFAQQKFFLTLDIDEGPADPLDKAQAARIRYYAQAVVAAIPRYPIAALKLVYRHDGFAFGMAVNIELGCNTKAWFRSNMTNLSSILTSTSAQPFRLLDLPAELRVRIYESFFEPNPGTPQEISLLDIHKHVPELAVLATSRLVRREAYAVGKTAGADFFARNQFVLDLFVDEARSQESPELQAATAALPCYPISRMALGWYVKPRTDLARYTARMAPTVLYLTSEGLHCAYIVESGCSFGRGLPNIITLMKEEATLLGLALTRGHDGAYLDIKNIMTTLGNMLAKRDVCYLELGDRNIAEMVLAYTAWQQEHDTGEDLYE